MPMKMPSHDGKHRLILTFDIEDFINPNALSALYLILEILQKHSLRALFFITGNMAEKLGNLPKIVELLDNHEIGFHSSGHSIRPLIAEYTDVEDYHEAYLRSLERETAHIDPLSGKTKGEGGIYSLQDLFHPKKIKAFRAPGMSWTPPHLEALNKLGIEFDFSSCITTSEPAYYKGITFYPYTFAQEWKGNSYDYRCLLSALLKRAVSIFDLHPSQYVNQRVWDSIYYAGNPPKLLRVNEKPLAESSLLFGRFELLLKRVSMLRHAGLIEVDSNLVISHKELSVDQSQVQKYYETSMRWPKRYFNYTPRFIHVHFNEFFNP
jgi:peptidoglycan/xylan/chitin deacetylase (PgdA/CDA1 family)